MMMMFFTLTIAALVGSVSASFSVGCVTTLMSLASNSDVAACLNPSMLLPVLIGAGNGQDSMVAPIDSWLKGTCASQACSNDTISTVVTNLTAGCGTEFNLSSSQASQTVQLVQQYYATAREVMCLGDSSGNLCVTDQLNLIQTSVGTLSLTQANINSILLLGSFGFTPNITCTDCMHGAVTIINQNLPGVIPQANMDLASSACGASFVDGGIPSGLIQTASGAINVTNSSSTATTLSSTASTASYSTYTSPSPTTSQASSPSPTSKSSALGLSSPSLSSFISISILASTLFLAIGV